jgi:hypothetical protein
MDVLSSGGEAVVEVGVDDRCLIKEVELDLFSQPALYGNVRRCNELLRELVVGWAVEARRVPGSLTVLASTNCSGASKNRFGRNSFRGRFPATNSSMTCSATGPRPLRRPLRRRWLTIV